MTCIVPGHDRGSVLLVLLVATVHRRILRPRRVVLGGLIALVLVFLGDASKGHVDALRRLNRQTVP